MVERYDTAPRAEKGGTTMSLYDKLSSLAPKAGQSACATRITSELNFAAAFQAPFKITDGFETIVLWRACVIDYRLHSFPPDKTLEKVYHCPAVDKNGHETGVTCAKCKRCIVAKRGEKTAVYAH